MFKFESSRLAKTNYNFNLSFKQAQKNDEIIALGDNQLFRLIRQLKKRSFDPTNKSSMFMPEVASIEITNIAHYKKLIKDGLILNRIKYKRFLCGAGHARNNTVYFVVEDLFNTLNEILKNNHNPIQMNPAKYNAYFGLYASASRIVSTPSVCVIKDFKFNDTKKVDWIEGDIVTVVDRDIEFNAFDGQGLISPEMAEQWAEDLDLTYVPSEFIIRAPFIKGMVAVFDFHQFAIDNHQKTIIDIWGNTHPINCIDVLLSESQFKLWAAYPSWSSFEESTLKNNLTWGVVRPSPKKDKDVAFTNYQYIQTLKLSDKDIKGLCKPTIDWLRGVATDEDPMQAILFLLGDKYTDIYDVLSAKDMDVGKVVVLNNELLKHPYVKTKINHMIQRKLNDACLGKLAVHGNYQMMVADPYAQVQWAFGFKPTGLLKEKEYFSAYWNSQGVNKVDSCRSPMTHYSEHNILNFINNKDTAYYFQYLSSGIILNIWGDDCMRFADSDFDGDTVMTTSNEFFINGVEDGLLPITYDKKSAPKTDITYETCCQSDLASFDTKIGVITNYSTSLYSLESSHTGNKLKEIQTRIKILRREQGNQIDKAKGVEITGFPTHWIKWSKVEEDDIEEVKKEKDFNNDIIIEKKPYFMTYVYPALKNELKKWLNNMNGYSKKTFGMPVDVLVMKSHKTEQEEKFLRNYEKFVPVDMASCTMNRLCLLMEQVVVDLNNWKKNKDGADVDWILKNDTRIDPEKLGKIKRIYKEYQTDKKNKKILEKAFLHEDFISTTSDKEDVLDRILEVVEKDEICNYCLELGGFLVWELGLEELVNNVYNNKQKEVWLPIPDEEEGEWLYLNKKYRKVVCDI